MEKPYPQKRCPTYMFEHDKDSKLFIIWIEPFWRGPEGAPITQKRHHLQ